VLSRERFENAHPYRVLSQNFILALGSSHCVVEVLDDAFDKIFPEFKVTEMVERREELEVLHEPCRNRKQIFTVLHE